jgi:hypothetical protein
MPSFAVRNLSRSRPDVPARRQTEAELASDAAAYLDANFTASREGHFAAFRLAPAPPVDLLVATVFLGAAADFRPVVVQSVAGFFAADFFAPDFLTAVFLVEDFLVENFFAVGLFAFLLVI